MGNNDFKNINLCVGQDLGEELFLQISRLVPVPNVDLLLTDKANRILLSRRNDNIYGAGWHLPGGCVRFCETMLERVQKTALAEIGTKVVLLEENPIAIRDVIMERGERERNNNVRAHNITILFHCAVPEGFEIDNKDKCETDAGFLKWFEKIPRDFLKVHEAYKEELDFWRS